MSIDSPNDNITGTSPSRLVASYSNPQDGNNNTQVNGEYRDYKTINHSNIILVVNPVTHNASSSGHAEPPHNPPPLPANDPANLHGDQRTPLRSATPASPELGEGHGRDRAVACLLCRATSFRQRQRDRLRTVLAAGARRLAGRRRATP